MREELIEIEKDILPYKKKLLKWVFFLLFIWFLSFVYSIIDENPLLLILLTSIIFLVSVTFYFFLQKFTVKGKEYRRNRIKLETLWERFFQTS